MSGLRVEKLIERDEREGAGITRYGKSPYLLVGFKIIIENKEEEKFLEDFHILHEDTNGYMEVDIKKDNISIYTFKGW